MELRGGLMMNIIMKMIKVMLVLMCGKWWKSKIEEVNCETLGVKNKEQYSKSSLKKWFVAIGGNVFL